MSDIAFSMTSDEKDVVRGLQSVGKETGKLREQISGLVTASKEAGAADNAIAQQRLAGLTAVVEKQKALKTQTAALAQDLKDGKITADEYKKSFDGISKESNELTTQLRQLQTQVNEDTADFKKAGVIIGQTEDKTEKYSRAVAELNRLKEKGILTSKQHTNAIAAEQAKLNDTGEAAGKSGGFISGLTGKMAGFVGGLGLAAGVITLLKSEYDALIERQGKSRDANISLATEQEALLMNLGGADAGQVTGSISKLSKESGIKEENVTRAVNEAMAARADMSVDDVVSAVGTASKIRKFAPSELAGLAGATIDTQKQTGLGTDEALGFLLQMQGQSRTKNLKGLAENFTPAVGGIMNFGADRQVAGGILASLSHGMGDTSGAQSATSGIQLAKQLREYGLQGSPELAAKMKQLETFQDSEKSALTEEFDKRGIELNTKKMPTEQKAELRRQLSAEEKERKAALKDLHGEQAEKLQGTAQAVPIADVIARMQADPAYRAQFLKGKDQGGFGASFEAKALPAIESLLSGGTQAQQFKSARAALSQDPTVELNRAIASRNLPGLQLAEADQRFGNVADQMKIADKGGAMSAIARDRLREVRDAMGKSALSTKVDTIMTDLGTGGNRGIDGTIQSVEALQGELAFEREQSEFFQTPMGRQQAKTANASPAMRDVNTTPWDQRPEAAQEKLLLQLIEELKGLRSDQQGNAHAGNIAARRNAQGEGAP